MGTPGAADLRQVPVRASLRPFSVVVVLTWGAAALLLVLPVTASWSSFQKGLVLLFPALLGVVVVLAQPTEGFGLWAVCLTLMVSQTGFQAHFGQLPTSALEVAVPALLAILLLENGSHYGPLVRLKDLPGYRWLIAFILYSTVLLFFGLLRRNSIVNAAVELKGFVLYPLMIYLLLAGIRSERLVWGVVLLLSLWYAVVAARGALDFLNHTSIVLPDYTYAVYRVGADYAPVTIFGGSSVAMALFSLGVAIAPSVRVPNRWVFVLAAIVMLLGAWTTVSRGAMLSLAIGATMLAVLVRRRRLAITLLIAIGAVTLVSIVPADILRADVRRLFQLSDSSSIERLFYIESGLRALQVYWPIGAGWGNGFWYYAGVGLVPSGSIPWYHNDYLNLAVQAGLPGLVLYVAFWFSLLWALWRWLRQIKPSPTTPYVIGGIAALSSLLVGALFDHFLWRPDIAGLVAWVAGVTLAATRIKQPEAVQDETSSA